jgi:hypothetical protein
LGQVAECAYGLGSHHNTICPQVYASSNDNQLSTSYFEKYQIKTIDMKQGLGR